MDKLCKMPNIGVVLEKKLIEVGIESPEVLRSCGSKEAFMGIRFMDNTACYNMLCALEGACQGVRWHNLSDRIKQDLRIFYESVK